MTQEPNNLKTIFLGTPRFAQIILEKLVNSPFKPQLAITAPDTKVGRGQKLAPSPVKQTATENNIKVAYLSRRLLKRSDHFDIAILVAYGKIIAKDILEIPKYGFVNVHPSLLPKYRGPSPIQTAILDGAEKTGITIMLLDEKVDHGPILAQREIKIEKDDTHSSLIENLGKLGADLLIEVLPQYIFHLRGEKTLHLEGVLRSAKIYLPPKLQDHSKATFTKIIKKSDGYIDLAHPPDPQTLDRMIRAFYPWPTVWTQIVSKNQKGKESKLRIKFLPSSIDTLTHRHIDTFLIQPEGKQPMKINDVKNGYPQLYAKISQLFGGKAQS